MEQEQGEGKNVLLQILRQKCPKCGSGNIFLENTRLFDFPVMRENCEVCGYKFRKEPGFFFGSMYVSYGLAVVQAVVVFAILHYGAADLSLFWVGAVIILVLLLLAKWNYRISRAVWIYMFS